MESLSLTTPEVTQITTNTYKIASILFYWEQATIVISLRGENGELKTFTYGGNQPDTSQASRDKATNLMITINKMNFSTVSLQKRIFTQLINDGFITGTVTGTPD
jgi:hypothetical protein